MAITNIPTADHFEQAAKTAFFAGWNDLLHLISDFEHHRERDYSAVDDWEIERKRYYDHCKVELEKICSWAGQATELALKSKICAVSPYLLLLGTDPRFKASGGDIDFTDLRTLDATDLVTTVNSVCPKAMSPQFTERFNRLRQWRNKIVHQGTSNAIFQPKQMAELLANQYAELWPEKQFLSDWMAYISGTRFSFFHDGDWSTPHMELAEMLDCFYETLGSGQIEALTGRKKGARRYVCHECYYEGSLGRGAVSESEFRTAFLISQTKLRCLLCHDDYTVERRMCRSCEGDVISTSDDFGGNCHTCGATQRAA
ncbi:hypothetical protein [Agrobacterium sp. LAD9]|uniref:hypothetical protein n=1 Tax=Agrobacterium sp. LAD9 TaxID=2055153 RepID=UPI000D1DD2D7|nr:hypothetical protein [Agrobacterium sp. LAD9]